MAAYHLSVKVISRADGRSAVAAAAYRSATELLDERLGRTHDFSHKAGVVHSEILLPAGAPEYLLDRASLWNAVEAGEKRKDAQLAREVEIALPRELEKAEAIQLARDFVAEQFVSRGMAADLNVHWVQAADGEAQPHAHVMLTMRAVGPEGFGVKVRDWNRTEVLTGWRERWAELANERLAELGHDLRIDHRSYVAQGIALEPQNKIGPAGMRREARGEDAERAADHVALARRNGERILAEPETVLEVLTRQQSTFTRRDLARVVDRHTADATQFAQAMARVEASPERVRVGLDGRGQERFSTRTMLAIEQRMEQAAVTLAAHRGHRVGASRRQALSGSTTLGEEQALAFRHVTQTRDLSVVVGYAGTGKSTMLGVAREAWESAGYQVRGAALSGIAAQGLEAGSGIASRTVHSLLYQWEQGREMLSRRDVLVVDEAGMIGSRQMERLLSAAQAAGAKVVLVGDAEQLQAIEAGAAFRAIAERVGVAEITEVRRQHAVWQQEATRALATGRTGEALGRYEAAGMVHGHATLDDAKAAMIAGWDTVRRQTPAAQQIMLAYRRVDVRDLNERARAVRQAAGELGADHAVRTERGERRFAVNDRVYFLKNERSLGVKNGTLGTVLEIGGSPSGSGGAAGEGLRGERLTVRLDDGRVVRFDVKDYAQIDHGYAATVHKSQGVTVDRAHVLASSHMDRHVAYVGLSRHRDSVQLHWSEDQVGDRARLTRVLSRERLKDTSLDYALAPAEMARTEAGREVPDVRDAVRAYAERRGLVPESEIILRERQVEVAWQQAVPAQAAAAKPRRGLVDGLDAGPVTPEPVHPAATRGRERPAKPAAPQLRRGMFEGLTLDAGPSVPAAAPAAAPLERAVRVYARAWADTARMRAADLPVLPHQTAALGKAGETLEGLRPRLAQDLAAALRHTPTLAHKAGTAAGLGALIQAGQVETERRQGLEVKARQVVQDWTRLEQAYAQAGTRYDWQRQQAIGTRLQQLARAVKQDVALDGLLRQQGAELGLAATPRLAQVVRSRSIEDALEQSHILSQGRGYEMER